jgi:AcrR family transcriptional regulator
MGCGASPSRREDRRPVAGAKQEKGRARPAPAPPQQARSRETRRKLLAAALESLAELGYAGATMDQVVERAGVSRGAQVHHFPTKSLLMQAALTEMLDTMIEDLGTQTDLIRRRQQKPSAVFRHLWEAYFSSRLFAITIELIVAARTDAELREVLTPVSERFHRQVDECFRVISDQGDRSNPRAGAIVNLTMSLLRGMGVQTVLYDRPEAFRQQLSDWFDIVERLLDDDLVAGRAQAR